MGLEEKGFACLQRESERLLESVSQLCVLGLLEDVSLNSWATANGLHTWSGGESLPNFKASKISSIGLNISIYPSTEVYNFENLSKRVRVRAKRSTLVCSCSDMSPDNRNDRFGARGVKSEACSGPIRNGLTRSLSRSGMGKDPGSLPDGKV